MCVFSRCWMKWERKYDNINFMLNRSRNMENKELALCLLVGSSLRVIDLI